MKLADRLSSVEAAVPVETPISDANRYKGFCCICRMLGAEHSVLTEQEFLAKDFEKPGDRVDFIIYKIEHSNDKYQATD